MPKYETKLVTGYDDKFNPITTLRATSITKQGDRYIAQSPNLFDNLVISSGAAFRVE